MKIPRDVPLGIFISKEVGLSGFEEERFAMVLANRDGVLSPLLKRKDPFGGLFFYLSKVARIWETLREQCRFLSPLPSVLA